MNANKRDELWRNKGMRLNLYYPSKSTSTQDRLTKRQGQLESDSCSTEDLLKGKICSFFTLQKNVSEKLYIICKHTIPTVSM